MHSAAPSATMSLIDFAATPMAANYSGFYAKVVDGIFTAEECKELSSLVTDWKPAGLSAEGPTQSVHSDFRNSDRCLIFDHDVAARVYERLYPLITEIHQLSPSGEYPLITGKAGRKQGPTWKLVRCVILIGVFVPQELTISIGLTSASAFYAMVQDTTSNPTAMDLWTSKTWNRS